MSGSALQRIQERLAEFFQPSRIYVFGSHAWGNPGEESDIDVCVILKESPDRPYMRIRKGLHALGDLKVPVDLLVYTEEEIRERQDHPSTLIHKIVHKGRKVFEAP